MGACELIRKTKKILTEPQYRFLKQLAYWSLNSKDYGLKKDGKTWIYNTYGQWAEQLQVSVSTVRRVAKSLSEMKFISADYLARNKRDRTLYYSINFDQIEEFSSAKTERPTAAANARVSEGFGRLNKQINEQMDEHMYIDNKKQNNKSNKSQDDLGADNFGLYTDSTVCRASNENYSDTEKIISAKEVNAKIPPAQALCQTVVPKYKNTGCNVTLPLRGERQAELGADNFGTYTDSTVCGDSEKNYSDTEKIISAKEVNAKTPAAGPSCTTVQDMMKILKEELFAKQEIRLNKQLARYLVASFKLKFENSLEKWKRYLRLIKTSSYMMSEKFKLSVWWIIKFATIDRIRAGELGVDESKIPADASEIEQKALAHAEAVEESAACRQYRREIIRKFSPAVYLSWFTKVDLMEEAKQVVIRAANKFVRDYIDANFLDKFEEFGKSRVCG